MDDWMSGSGGGWAGRVEGDSLQADRIDQGDLRCVAVTEGATVHRKPGAAEGDQAGLQLEAALSFDCSGA